MRGTFAPTPFGRLYSNNNTNIFGGLGLYKQQQQIFGEIGLRRERFLGAFRFGLAWLACFVVVWLGKSAADVTVGQVGQGRNGTKWDKEAQIWGKRGRFWGLAWVVLGIGCHSRLGGRK